MLFAPGVAEGKLRSYGVERSVPVWFVLLCFLLWGLLTISFGWAVRSTLLGSDRSGKLGELAVDVAGFPTQVKDVIVQLSGYAFGEYQDEELRVRREADDDYSAFEPIPFRNEPAADGLLMHANRERMVPGWRLIAGAFHVEGTVENAVVLLSPELEVVRTWVLDEIPVGDQQPRPKYRKFVHGVEILPDGSLVFTFDGSVSLQRVGACGERQWAVPGKFSHAVTLDETAETVWTFENENAVQIRVADGREFRRITPEEIIASNPTIDILQIRRVFSTDHVENSRNTPGKWLFDPLHYNDVDPLPSALVDRFPGFEAGDLLLSARSPNLVYVLDPDTLKVKWWRIGAVQRQHDPDWLADGRIMVFNNRMGRDYSEIVTLDPETFERTTLFDGRRNDFYTRIRGKSQMLADGTLVVSSPQQGRAFEVASDGETVFEVVNVKPSDDTFNYVISEMRWLPLDYFDLENWECPTTS